MSDEIKPSEKKLIVKLRDLLKCKKNGESQIVTIKRVGDRYQLGAISNQGIIDSK